MKHTLRDERGMALALAVVALVVVGALVAGAFFSGTQEQRAAENSRRVLQAFGVAEEGAYEVVDKWNPLKNDTIGAYPANSLSVGGWPSYWSTASNKTGVYGGFVYHFNNELYLVDMTGRDSVSVGNAGLVTRGGGGRTRLGLLLRDRPLQLGIKGALTTGNSNKVAGNTTINGVDQTPTGWGACGSLKPPIAGIRASTGSSVSTSGGATVIGNPPVLIDSTLKDTNFTHYGSVTYAQLANMATITLAGQNFATGILPATNALGQCDQTVLTNWGDPLNPTAPCGGYFPIIHITGSATINGQEGQGILLVDGNLSVQGGFQFYGITIIQGSLSTAGGGGSPAHFWGATIVRDSVSLGTNTISGSANLLYSSCAVQKALEMTAIVTLMRSRSWVPLF